MNEKNLPPAVAKLPWTHNIMLIEKIKDKNIRFWYANEATKDNWSKVVLDHQIDINLYERKALFAKRSLYFNLSLLKDKYIEKELEESIR